MAIKLDYVARDLTSPDGGFYSAEDADSFPTKEAKEKKEGAFYVWEKRTAGVVAPELFPGELADQDNDTGIARHIRALI